MTRKVVLAIVAVIMVALLLSGCVAPGQDPEKLARDLAEAQGQLAAAQGQTAALKSQLDQKNGELQAAKADKAAVDSKLSTAQSQISQLQNEVNKLKQDNSLTGSTSAETAAKIVKLYHETHVYSSYDLYVCGDMSQDVWNMLKAQNINAKIQVGSTKSALKEISDSDHAWVLAEVAPGSYLALETTGGFTVTEKENPFYYQGWSFKSPKDLKDYLSLLSEYRLRADIVNDMVVRYNQMGANFNSQYGGKPPAEVQGRMSQFLDEINKQKAPLPGLKARMQGLVS